MPATAIMAPLSVQSRGGGRKTPHPLVLGRARRHRARSRLLAATPPESTSRVELEPAGGRKAFCTSAPTMASW